MNTFRYSLIRIGAKDDEFDTNLQLFAVFANLPQLAQFEKLFWELVSQTCFWGSTDLVNPWMCSTGLSTETDHPPRPPRAAKTSYLKID